MAVPMCSFDGIRRCNYFGGEPTGRAEVEVRVGKLKNGKAVWWVTGEMITDGGDSLCNMYKGKEREMNVRTMEVLAC